MRSFSMSSSECPSHAKPHYSQVCSIRDHQSKFQNSHVQKVSPAVGQCTSHPVSSDVKIYVPVAGLPYCTTVFLVAW